MTFLVWRCRNFVFCTKVYIMRIHITACQPNIHWKLQKNLPAIGIKIATVLSSVEIMRCWMYHYHFNPPFNFGVLLAFCSGSLYANVSLFLSVIMSMCQPKTITAEDKSPKIQGHAKRLWPLWNDKAVTLYCYNFFTARLSGKFHIIMSSPKITSRLGAFL